MIALALSVSLALVAPQEPDEHPLQLDRTGLEWVLPYDAAVEAAEERGRLLLVKPVAFGTTQSGCW